MKLDDYTDVAIVASIIALVVLLVKFV